MRRMFSSAAVAIATTTVLFGRITPSIATPIDACSLMTKEDAAAALGEAVQGPKSTVVPSGSSACEYTGSGIHSVHLNVMPFTAATADVYKGLCAKKSKDGLTGLGDTTCWYNDKHGELQVLKGLTFFSIELRRSGDPTEPIKALARKVYERVK